VSIDVRCQDGQGNGCGKKLAEVAGPTLTIVCPRCGRLKEVSIVVLIQELQTYLAEVEAACRVASGKGFML
jgi:phage FluMu protein Com